MPSFARRLGGSIQPLLWHLFAGAQQHRGSEPAHRARYERLVDLLERAGAQPGDRVLELGCGTGDGLLALADRGFVVVGIDAAPGMVKRARAQLALRSQARAAVCRLNFNRQLPFADASFDHAVCISALQLAVDRPKVVAELVRVVRARGLILVATAAAGRARTRPAVTASRTHRALYDAKALMERSGLVPNLDARDLAVLLRNARAITVDTHVIDGLNVAVSSGRSELGQDRHELR